MTHGNSEDIGTHGRVSEGADNETLLAAIAFVVDGDDFARLTTIIVMRTAQCRSFGGLTVISPLMGPVLNSSILS